MDDGVLTIVEADYKPVPEGEGGSNNKGSKLTR